MKVGLYWALIGVTLLMSACSKSKDDSDVVQSSYIHKYGVTMSKHDWEARGKDGQVITTRTDGVVVTKNFASGQLDGECSETFPHSKTIAKTENYKEGNLVKEVTNFNSGMPMREEQNTASGSKVVTCWYESGRPLSVEEYQNGRLITAKYYNTQGACDSQVINGEGARKVRDGYGQLLSCDTIINGEKTLRTTYHPNGAPNETIPYVSGVVNGMKKTFLPGGEPNTIEEWVSGQQHGTTTVFRNGEKYAEVPYYYGIKKGLERRFRDGKLLEEEITWNNGQRHGPSRAFVGENVRTDWYFQDKLVSKLVFDQMSHTG